MLARTDHRAERALQDLQQAWRIFVNSTLVAESARVAKEAAVAAAAALRG